MRCVGVELGGSGQCNVPSGLDKVVHIGKRCVKISFSHVGRYIESQGSDIIKLLLVCVTDCIVKNTDELYIK